MFESLQALKGGQSETCAGHGSSRVTAEVRPKRWCLAPPGIGPTVTLVEDGETRAMVTRANASDNTRSTDESGTHTSSEIGSEIFVQLVKMGFGDDGGIQRGVISTLVWRTLWLERAVLIAGDSRVGGRGRGGRRAGGARRPLHGVHGACRGREGEGDGSVGVVGGRADEMRRPFSVNVPPAPIGSTIHPVPLFAKPSPFSHRFYTQDCTFGYI